eukprot:CAMPEP_0183359330 /NCGR_PEP_ID=MMETSP0164_2-20130417/51880_1 /TAXON_ID=221442 /ORGANISM="Coccolithus pelagicus ssp braarudi, Strain PLY182g" /LENGTH=73 /DNA_ID=CAMNT_0025533409 /DNA_START=316 /DNA_END=538 /DNA_ORIENTATION=-
MYARACAPCEQADAVGKRDAPGSSASHVATPLRSSRAGAATELGAADEDTTASAAMRLSRAVGAPTPTPTCCV